MVVIDIIPHLLLSGWLAFVSQWPPLQHAGFAFSAALTFPLTLLALSLILSGRSVRHAAALWLPIVAYLVILEPRTACDTLTGLYWLALGPGVGWFFGVGLGLFLRNTLTARRGHYGGWVAGASLVLLSCLATAARLYMHPQMRVLDPFFGTWHGPIYEEYVPLDQTTVVYRVAVFGLAAALWLCANPGPLRQRPLMLIAVLLSGFYSIYPSHHLMDREDLGRVLSQSVYKDGVTVRFSTKTGRSRALRLLEQGLFERDSVAVRVGAPPDAKVTIWWYPSAGVKRQLIGAGGVLIARPWQNEIHLNQGVIPDPYLRHEMVHVIAGQTVDNLFRVPLAGLLPSSALIEGYAVLHGPHDQALSLHGSAAALLARRQLPSAQALFSGAFVFGHGRRTYRAAGSLLRFIEARHGAEVLRRAYSSGKLEGIDLAQIDQEWRAMLAKRPAEPDARRVMLRHYAGRPAALRPCPVAVQAAWRKAQSKRLDNDEDRHQAYRKIMALDGSCRALASLADRHYRKREPVPRRALEDEMLARGVSARSAGRIFARRADEQLSAGDHRGAQEHLLRALAAAPPLPEYRGLLVRWMARSHPAVARAVAAYLDPRSRRQLDTLIRPVERAWSNAPASAQPALAYLLLRYRGNRGDFAAAEAWLRRAAPLPHTLRVETDRYSAELAERAKQPCLAAQRWRRVAQQIPGEADLLPQRLGWLRWRYPGERCAALAKAGAP
jgi:hypothetical protein